MRLQAGSRCLVASGALHDPNTGTTITFVRGATTVGGTGIAGGLMLTLGDIVGALWSDRIGRRKVLLGAALVAVVWSVVMFPIINVGSVFSFGAGVIGTMFLAGLTTGPLGAFLTELFATQYRYTATGLSYNIAGIIGGAIPPLVATSITAHSGGLAFGFFLASCAPSAQPASGRSRRPAITT